MFIWIPKINFIIHFFLKILHFKKSCNFIGQQHFGPKLENQNFVRYENGGDISIIMLVFILDYFQEKLMTKFFIKKQKTFFWDHFGPFCPNFDKKEFLCKKGSVNFSIFQLSTIAQKIRKI